MTGRQRDAGRGKHSRPGTHRGGPRRFGVMGSLGALLLLAATLPGCGAISSSFAVAAADVDAGAFAADAGADTAVPTVRGSGVGDDAGVAADLDAPTPGSPESPLCAGSSATEPGDEPCDPDRSATCVPPAERDAGVHEGDGEPAPDAGEYASADAGPPAIFACHVTAVRPEAGAASASLVCSAAGSGQSESPCAAPRDCAPGFECVVDAQRGAVDGATAGGVCRHYCCMDTCAHANSFCDIETTVSGAVSVPVCVSRPPSDAGAPCTLLDDATCGSSGLTCQVVNRASGQVACVTPGTAMAGQSCETTNCAKGLSCIAGFFPNRTCAQLCDPTSGTCPKGEQCMVNAMLSSATSQIGVCGP